MAGAAVTVGSSLDQLRASRRNMKMLTMLTRITLLVCIAAVAPTAAHAQTNTAQAEKLFNDGIALMDKNDYPAACAKFEASQKLDPVPSTLLNLANCRE